MNTLTLSSKAEQLTKQTETFLINPTSRLEHQGRKSERRALEVLIVEGMLLGLCIMLARRGTGDVVDGERTGDSHIPLSLFFPGKFPFQKKEGRGENGRGGDRGKNF